MIESPALKQNDLQNLDQAMKLNQIQNGSQVKVLAQMMQ